MGPGITVFLFGPSRDARLELVDCTQRTHFERKTGRCAKTSLRGARASGLDDTQRRPTSAPGTVRRITERHRNPGHARRARSALADVWKPGDSRGEVKPLTNWPRIGGAGTAIAGQPAARDSRGRDSAQQRQIPGGLLACTEWTILMMSGFDVPALAVDEPDNVFADQVVAPLFTVSKRLHVPASGLCHTRNAGQP